MNPEVLAEGGYGDFTALAALARGVPGPLGPPRQQSNGDCWLLAAAFGLQTLFPRIYKEMIQLGSTTAVVSFPRAGAVAVNYVFSLTMAVRIAEAADVYWAVLEKALCLCLCRASKAPPSYGVLNGGRVHDALRLLSPAPFAPRIPVASDVAALSRSGLFFLEVLRGGARHSLLVLGAGGGFLFAYDPWGATASVPLAAAPVLWYHPLGASRGVASSAGPSREGRWQCRASPSRPSPGSLPLGTAHI